MAVVGLKKLKCGFNQFFFGIVFFAVFTVHNFGLCDEVRKKQSQKTGKKSKSLNKSVRFQARGGGNLWWHRCRCSQCVSNNYFFTVKNFFYLNFLWHILPQFELLDKRNGKRDAAYNNKQIKSSSFQSPIKPSRLQLYFSLSPAAKPSQNWKILCPKKAIHEKFAF